MCYVTSVVSNSLQPYGLYVAGQVPLSMEFSRQEYWSGLPFPSPMHESESEVAQSRLTLCDPIDSSLPGSSVHGFSRQEYWSGLPLLYVYWTIETSVLALGWMTRTVCTFLAALNRCDLANPNSWRKLHKAAFTRLPNILELCHL